jgi:hypothetical protein
MQSGTPLLYEAAYQCLDDKAFPSILSSLSCKPTQGMWNPKEIQAKFWSENLKGICHMQGMLSMGEL